MTARPIRPCLDCGSATRQGSRCPACRAVHESARRGRYRDDRVRPTTRERGLGGSWPTIARAAIAAQPWCSFCGTTEDLTCDHIVPRKHGGEVSDGVQVLCRPCNGRKGARSL